MSFFLIPDFAIYFSFMQKKNKTCLNLMLYSWNLFLKVNEWRRYLQPIQWKTNRHEWRMGFIRIRQAADRRINGRKNLPEIHEDNSPASALSFSSFVKLWLWRNMLLWMSCPKRFLWAPNLEIQRCNESDIALVWRHGSPGDNVSATKDLWDKHCSCQTIYSSFHMNSLKHTQTNLKIQSTAEDDGMQLDDSFTMSTLIYFYWAHRLLWLWMCMEMSAEMTNSLIDSLTAWSWLGVRQCK